MGFFGRVFRKHEKHSYSPRTYVPTPGPFGHVRTPSEVLTVQHPSPHEYRASSFCDRLKMPEDEEEEEFDLLQTSSKLPLIKAPSHVNMQTAKEQWHRLQSHSAQRQALPEQSSPLSDQAQQRLQQRSKSEPLLRVPELRGQRDLTPSLRRPPPPKRISTMARSIHNRDLTPSITQQISRRHSAPELYPVKKRKPSSRPFQHGSATSKDLYSVKVPGSWVD